MWQPQPDIIYLGSKRTWLYTSLFSASKMLLYQRAQRLHTFILGKQNWSRKISGKHKATIKNFKKKTQTNKTQTKLNKQKPQNNQKRKKSTCSLNTWLCLKFQPEKHFKRHSLNRIWNKQCCLHSVQEVTACRSGEEWIIEPVNVLQYPTNQFWTLHWPSLPTEKLNSNP